MRNCQLKLACIFLGIRNFHQKLQFMHWFLSNPNSKAYFVAPRTLILLPIHLAGCLRLRVKKITKTKPVNRLCFMLGNLILQLTMKSSEHIWKACNGGWQNWRKYAGKCRIRWEKLWDQESQATLVPNLYPGFAHELSSIYYLLPYYIYIYFIYVY